MIEALVAAGHDAVAMARSDRSAEKVERYGATPVRAALGSVSQNDLAGCDAVVHAAAFVEEWGTRAQFWEANVEGTTQLLEVAERAGVTRFIHIGTEAALFDGRALVQIDETEGYPQKQRFLYSETKAEAERRVLAASTERFTTLSIRPRFVWGPRDTSVRPAIVRMANAGGWTWLDGGRARTSTTHVENLVHAVLLGLENGRGGEAYFVADAEESSLESFLSELAHTAGVELPRRSLPGAVVRPIATVLDAAYRMVGSSTPPPITRFAAAMMSRTITVRTDKAERELGYAPVITLAEGFEALRGS